MKPTANTRWRELDILRGLAALLMIVNHLGNETLAPQLTQGGLTANLLFIGSAAPVLFFFVTGVGYGVQASQRKKGHWYATLNKVAILVLADLLMHWSGGSWWGLDFLGFIGLISLVMEVIRNTRSPLTYCLIGFVAISLMRYGIGPKLHGLGYDQQFGGVLGFIFGTNSTPGISYPLSPWLAYPLLGYAVGVAAVYYREAIEKQRLLVISGLIGLAAVPACAGLFLAQRGVSFFRWGTVGLGFYVVSFAIILVSLALSNAIAGENRTQIANVLSLKGIASLAVVPIHYLLIAGVASVTGKTLSFLGYIGLAIAVSILSFLLAYGVERLSTTLRQQKNQTQIWLLLVFLFAIAATITLGINQQNPPFVIFTRTFGQLVLCLLFVIRPPDRFTEKTN